MTNDTHSKTKGNRNDNEIKLHSIDAVFKKPYEPTTTESVIYDLWEKSGYFNPDNLPDATNKTPYTIVMPPPNANGDLHAGHALFITLEDILIRFKRMQGYRALWIPGADHAGFETQVVYEKKLTKEGRSRFKMDPKELYDEIYEFTRINKKNMETQVRSLGASCDWSREKFTLDPDIISRVQDTFIKMYNDGLIYRGNRIVNWCPKHQTSLSDVETTSVEETAPLYYFKYGPFTIATARPETKFGDKYVVMHPDDPRYKKWAHGEQLELEWINGPITATIIKDTAIDMEFGTGVMTITPWHDTTDFEIAKRHDLPFEQIIDWRGKLLPVANEFTGIKILDVRAKIVEKLAKKGLVVKINEQYEHISKRCYKCNTLIEPQVKDQWFVKMAPLARMALEAVNSGKVRFIPDNYEKIFRYWMENTLDWNISRQITWGISIPAWFKNRGADNEEVMVSTTQPEGDGWVADTDTFDTWFSSGQWPLLVTGYPDGIDFKTYYPTNVMETGHDLIFKWIPRMVMFGLYLSKRAPFSTVYLHGLVGDAHGKKMSKSKGNVVSPLVLTEKYGTDSLRMALIVGNTPGTDLSLREDKVKGYKHFANKLWNIARFILERTEDVPFDTSLTETDAKYAKEMSKLVEDVTKDMEEFRIHLAAEKIYHFTWHRLADKIIEESKLILSSEDVESIQSRSALLRATLDQTLRLLHPFMPFVTETIWQHAGNKKGELLMIASWVR